MCHEATNHGVAYNLVVVLSDSSGHFSSPGCHPFRLITMQDHSVLLACFRVSWEQAAALCNITGTAAQLLGFLSADC